MVQIGGRSLIMNEVTDPVFGRPDIKFSSLSDIHNSYAPSKVPNLCNNGRQNGQVPISRIWIESRLRRQYEGIVFNPGQIVPGQYNLYQGLAVGPFPIFV